MQRVLDIDLDFFVHEVAYYRESDDERLDEADFPAWDVDEAISFLRERCGLTGPLPGVVVEHHGQMFGRWRDLIESGGLAAPFHVTHVDAHADLGNGDTGYLHLMGDIVFRPVEERTHPDVGERGLTNGNYLAFAIGCRRLTDLTFVFNDEHLPDLFHMEGWDDSASNIQLLGVRAEEFDRSRFDMRKVEVSHREPVVPFRALLWTEFEATEPYDLVCLCRSPGFTPPTADVIFDAIRERFILPSGV